MMNIFWMWVFVGIVLIHVSGANAQLGEDVGNLFNKKSHKPKKQQTADESVTTNSTSGVNSVDGSTPELVGGIGAKLKLADGDFVVTSIIPGSPTDLDKRIKPNDHIFAVAEGDGPMVEIEGMTLPDVIRRIRGPKGTFVRLMVIPTDDPSRRVEIRLKRDQIAAITTNSTSGVNSADGSVTTTAETSASTPQAKAYKTLNFGDQPDVVEQKVAEITGEATVGGVPNFRAIHRSILIEGEDDVFGTQSQYDQRMGQAMGLGGDINNPIRAIYSENKFISVNCYVLDDSNPYENPKNEPKPNQGLILVLVAYFQSDTNKLIEAFLENYPHAQKETKHYKIESVDCPGIFLECDRIYYSELSADKKAELSIPLGSSESCTFADPSMLSEKQLMRWEDLAKDNHETTSGKEYYEKVRSDSLETLKSYKLHQKPVNSENATFLALVLSGYNKRDMAPFNSVPSAEFVSTQLLSPYLKRTRQQAEDEQNAEKTKLKKQSDSSNGF